MFTARLGEAESLRSRSVWIVAVLGFFALSACGTQPSQSESGSGTSDQTEGSSPLPSPGSTSDYAYAKTFPEIQDGLDKLHGIVISQGEGTPTISEEEGIARSEITTPAGYTPLAFHVLVTDKSYGPVAGGKVQPIVDHRDAWMIAYPGATDTLHPQFNAPPGTPDVLETFETVAFVDAQTGEWLEAVTI